MKAKGEKPTTSSVEAQGKKPRTPALAVPAKGVLEVVGVPAAAPKNKPKDTCFTSIPHLTPQKG